MFRIFCLTKEKWFESGELSFTRLDELQLNFDGTPYNCNVTSLPYNCPTICYKNYDYGKIFAHPNPDLYGWYAIRPKLDLDKVGIYFNCLLLAAHHMTPLGWVSYKERT